MKNRKWLTLSVMLVVVLSLLAGCAGNKGGNSAPVNEGSKPQESSNTGGGDAKPVKLKMWGGVPPESGPQAVVDAWNKENPNIQVEYVRFVNDDDGNLKLDTALLTGQDVDLYVNYSLTQVEKRIASNVALDLSGFSDYNIDEKMGADAAAWKVNDKYYGIPTKKNVFFVALNKDALDKAGLAVPKEWTWNEMREYAKTLKADFNYGLVQHTEPLIDPVDSGLVKAGYTKEDGSSNLENPVVKQWLETMNGMMREDKTTPLLGEQLTSKMPVENVFLGGEAAMLNIGEWLIRSSNNTTDFPRDFKIAFAPVPRLSDSAADFVTRGGLGDFISINAKSKNQEAAWEFLKWYADGGMAPMAAGGRLPASKDVDQETALTSLLGDKADTYDVDSLRYVLYEDKTPTFVRSVPQEVMDLRAQEYEKYFLGNQTADETLARMAQRHNDYLKQQK